MHNSSSRLVAIVFAFFFGALAVSGASGYVSPVRAQPPEQQPIIVMATPRLLPAMPTQAPPPTAVPVPTEVPAAPTPEPQIVIQYVEVPAVVEMPPTVALPTPFPTVSHVKIHGWVEMERPKVFEARPVRRPGDAPEAVRP